MMAAAAMLIDVFDLRSTGEIYAETRFVEQPQSAFLDDKPSLGGITGEVEGTVEIEVPGRGACIGRVQGRGDAHDAFVVAAPHQFDVCGIGNFGDRKRRPDPTALHELDIENPTRRGIYGQLASVLLAVQAFIGGNNPANS